VPSEPGLRVANDIYRRIIRELLGLSEIRAPMYCCCTGRKHKNKPNPKEGQRTALLPDDMASMAHIATCKYLGGQIATHDAALRLTVSIIKALPTVYARTEQSKIIENGRMDLVVHHIDGRKPIHYDMTVANPLAASHVQSAAARTLAIGNQRDYDKNQKWNERSEKAGYGFLALVYEVTGGMTKITERTYRAWAGLLNSVEPYQPVNFAAPTRMSYWQQLFSILLVTGRDRGSQNLLKHAIKDQPVPIPHPDYPSSQSSSYHQSPTSSRSDTPPRTWKSSPSF
jgi:hypothetical protein